MATNFKYASQSDLKNYFNNFGDYDQKVQIFNWIKNSDSVGTGGDDDDFDFYYSANTGYIDQLYFDGNEASSLSKTQVALVNDASVTAKVNSVTIDAGHGLAGGDIIKINNEYMTIAAFTDTNVMTVVRGEFNTSAVAHANDSIIYLVIDNSTLDDNKATSQSPFYYYFDSDLDICLLALDGAVITNPSEHTIESGTDFATFADQQLVNASMELNNLLDARFQMPLPKSTQIKEDAASGLTPEYDPVVIKCTCYIAASNLIRSKDVMSEEAQFYMDMVTNTEGTGLADRINAGHIKLSFEIDNKDSQGSIREISRSSGSMYLVETAGEFSGGKNGYDLLRITCTTLGVYGVAKCKVEYYGNDKLFGQETTDNIVTGGIDYWSGLGGIGVRFQGTAMAAGDIWEIEVYNEGMEETNSVTRNINLYR